MVGTMLNDLFLSIHLWSKTRFQSLVIALGFLVALTFSAVSLSSLTYFLDMSPKGVNINGNQVFTINGLDQSRESQGLSLKTLAELKAMSIVEDITYFSYSDVSIETGESKILTVTAGLVSNNFFDRLGIPVQVGVASNAFSSSKKVVLSYEFWMDSLFARKDVINEELFINGIPYRIAGVLTEEFKGLDSNTARVWISDDNFVDLLKISFGKNSSIPEHIIKATKENIAQNQNRLLVNVFANSKVDLEILNNEIERLLVNKTSNNSSKVIQENLKVQAYSGFNFEPKSNALFIMKFELIKIISALLVFSVAITFVSAIYNRTVGRLEEFETRIAVGATFSQLFKQMMNENGPIMILLAVSANILAATFNGFNIIPMSQNPLTYILIAAFQSLSLIVLTAVASLTPLLQVIQEVSNRSIDSKRKHEKKKYLEYGLITLQMAFMFVVVTVSLNVVGNLQEESSDFRGFNNSDTHILSLSIGFEDDSGNRLGTDDLHDLIRSQTEGRFAIENVAFSNREPQSRKLMTEKAIFVDDKYSKEIRILPIDVSYTYFETLGVQIIEGRTFRNADEVVVSRGFGDLSAKELLGREILIGMNPAAKKTKIVVGIAADVAHLGVGVITPATVYSKINEGSVIATEYLIFDSKVSNTKNWNEIVTNLLPKDSILQVDYMGSLESLIKEQYGKERQAVRILIILSLILSVFIITSASAIQNTNLNRKRMTLGIHLALGASRFALFLRVLGFYIVLTIIGMLLALPFVPIALEAILPYLELAHSINISSMYMNFAILILVVLLMNIPTILLLFRYNLSSLIHHR